MSVQDLCWDDVYLEDITNFMDNGDVGLIWFGTQKMNKIIKWIQLHNGITEDAPIVDLGCGNGVMLVELARAGYKNLLGIDFSPNAISLATAIASKEGFPFIQYEVHNILSAEIPEVLKKEFTVAIDKGTYDAVTVKSGSNPVRVPQYVEAVSKLLVSKGALIVVTCNWTEYELQDHFKSHFKPVYTMRKPKFEFGSGVGSTTSAVIFQKSA